MENVIRKLRGELSQNELAKKVGVSQAAIAKYEKGRNPNLDILEKIAEVVGKKLVITFEDIKEESEE